MMPESGNVLVGLGGQPVYLRTTVQQLVLHFPALLFRPSTSGQRRNDRVRAEMDASSK